MKEAGTSHWLSPNTNATNSSGFTGLPGGNRFGLNGAFYNIGAGGFWWSSSENGTNDAWNRELNYIDGKVSRYNYFKQNGFSVRCLRD